MRSFLDGSYAVQNYAVQTKTLLWRNALCSATFISNSTCPGAESRFSRATIAVTTRFGGSAPYNSVTRQDKNVFVIHIYVAVPPFLSTHGMIADNEGIDKRPRTSARVWLPVSRRRDRTELIVSHLMVHCYGLVGVVITSGVHEWCGVRIVW